MKLFSWTIIGIVALAVIAGFFIVGSPQNERLRRFDDRRIQDLMMLQSEIVYYWQNKKVLPLALDLIRDDIRGVRAPRDPETGAVYEYAVQGPLQFSLCALFALPDRGAEPSRQPIAPKTLPESETYWGHGGGRACFERTIDPDIYEKPKSQ